MADAGALRVEVVSPERVLFTGDARQVITRTLDGGETVSYTHLTLPTID
jgi:F0F1-type ATP synthase epsilon subunit